MLVPDNGRRILVADPNHFYRSLVRQFLWIGQSREVSEAECALEAMSYLFTRPYDLLICDWELMLYRDGGFLDMLSQRVTKGARRLPVLVTMARPTLTNVQVAASQGMTVVLRKPFSPMALQVRADLLVNQAPTAAAPAVASSAQTVV